MSSCAGSENSRFNSFNMSEMGFEDSTPIMERRSGSITKYGDMGSLAGASKLKSKQKKKL